MNIPDLSEIPDLEAAAEGEYNLKIVSSRSAKADNGREGYKFVVHNQDGNNYIPIFESIWFPLESEDEAKTQMMWRMVKEFVTALGLPPGDIGPEEFMGIEFSAMLGVRKNDYTGNIENYIIKITD